MMRRLALVMAVVSVWAPVGARAQGFAPELNPVLSKLQSMGHGTYTEAEWRDAMAQLDRVAAQAERNDEIGLVVQARAIKAMVLSDMRRDYAGALQVLDQSIRQFGRRSLPEMKRLYVQKAEVYSRMGDEAGVVRAIEEFRNSPNFDPTAYPYAVGQGRDTPLTLVRPSARGSDSVSVTAMEVARGRARHAAGNLFPDFNLVDSAGRNISLSELRGKVVLVDFWQQGWTPWRRDLDYQVSTYRHYNQIGFEIVGIALDRDGAAAQAFALQKQLPWPLIYGHTELARQLGIFGEAANFLIDRNGMIVGRDLRGANLSEAIKSALGVP